MVLKKLYADKKNGSRAQIWRRQGVLYHPFVIGNS